MRLGVFAPVLLGPILLSVALASCGGTEPAKPAAPPRTLEGDNALIASVQIVSDAIGGCVKPADATVDSKIVSLESASIVMLACSQGAYQYTHRLFAIKAGEKPELITLPDYDTTGWFGTDQASMAELDAGTGVLTTFRKSAGHGGCGSEGRYQWDGQRFALQEMHWQDCTAAEMKGPPFPTIWPAQNAAEVDPNGATPAP
jgi:uncharacterized protein DUF1176